MTQDTIRVLRIIEFTGPRKEVKEQVSRSLHGTKILPNGVRINVATVGNYPEILEELKNAGEFQEQKPKLESRDVHPQQDGPGLGGAEEREFLKALRRRPKERLPLFTAGFVPPRAGKHSLSEDAGYILGAMGKGSTLIMHRRNHYRLRLISGNDYGGKKNYVFPLPCENGEHVSYINFEELFLKGLITELTEHRTGQRYGSGQRMGWASCFPRTGEEYHIFVYTQ